MFDRTTITQDNSINFPEEINITHKYPTTSEQINTLREIEKELKSNLIGYTKVQDNIFNFNFFVTHSQGLGGNIELRVTYSLNGQSYDIEHCFDSNFDDVKMALQTLMRKVSDSILYSVLLKNNSDIFSQMRRALQASGLMLLPNI